jgi:hypothetical protein
LPLATVTSSKIYHEIDKTTGRSFGTMKLGLEIDRDKPAHRMDHFVNLTVVLGTPKHSKLLAVSDVAMSRGGSWSVEKELQFDWQVAIADGGEEGGHVVVRLLVDSCRGLDSEIMVGLV